MTPKEKAVELIDKMYFARRYDEGENYVPSQAWIHAKQCVLIAVDEIAQELSVLPYGRTYFSRMEYWREVKGEIEKI